MASNNIIDGALAYIGDEFPTVKTNTETMMNDTYPFRPILLGMAPSNTATSFTLTMASRNYVIISGHNSTANLNGIWLARMSGPSVFNLGGGSGVTITASSTSVIKVTPTNGSVQVWAIRLPS